MHRRFTIFLGRKTRFPGRPSVYAYASNILKVALLLSIQHAHRRNSLPEFSFHYTQRSTFPSLTPASFSFNIILFQLNYNFFSNGAQKYIAYIDVLLRCRVIWTYMYAILIVVIFIVILFLWSCRGLSTARYLYNLNEYTLHTLASNMGDLLQEFNL